MRNGRIFFLRREKEIYESALEMVENIADGTRFLQRGIEKMTEGRDQPGKESLEETLQISTQCEDLYAKLRKKVMSTIDHPSSREDLLRFTHGLLDLSKAMEAAAYRAEMYSGKQIPEKIKDDLVKLADSVSDAPEAVGKTIEDMPFDTDEALRHSELLHDIEERVDDTRRVLMRDLVQQADQIEQGDFYVLTEIIEKLEDIADDCDRIGQDIEFIVASR